MITTAIFRQFFTAFGDPSQFPDGRLLPWINLADKVIQRDIWGDMYDMGQALYVAHFVALDFRDERAVAGGGIPGQQFGIMNSKSVGGVSVGYDLGSTMNEADGFWNLTTYGSRLIYFARLVGMGGRQSGGPDIVLNPTFGPAWPGVIYPHG